MPRTPAQQLSLSQIDVSTLDSPLTLLPLLRALLLGDSGSSPVQPLYVYSGAENALSPAEKRAPYTPGTVLVVGTSGSTGRPKKVMLSADALRASAAATAQELGFAGQWLLALAPSYVAGLQVLCRSVLAGTEPVVDPSLLCPQTGFTVQGFTRAAGQMTHERRLVSLVPTQLDRLLTGATKQTLEVLQRFDAILVGGARIREDLKARCEELGLKIVMTYGAAETAGGCIYDGLPMAGALLDAPVYPAEPGPVRLGGPSLASGYLGDPESTAAVFEHCGPSTWYTTSDLGVIRQGRLEITERNDDVINTGALKVSARWVACRIEEIDGVGSAFVCGIEDEHWGERIAAFVSTGLSEEKLASALEAKLPSVYVPKTLLTARELLLLPHGKEDRLGMKNLLIQHHRREPRGHSNPMA